MLRNIERESWQKYVRCDLEEYMCWCVCVYIYVCVHVYIYLYTHIYVDIYICIHMWTYIYVHIHVCLKNIYTKKSEQKVHSRALCSRGVCALESRAPDDAARHTWNFSNVISSTRFTMFNTCRSEFEKLYVSEKHVLDDTARHTWKILKRFSECCSFVMLHSESSSKLTFEKFYLQRSPLLTPSIPPHPRLLFWHVRDRLELKE